MKRIFTILLAVVLVCSMGMTAYADTVDVPLYRQKYSEDLTKALTEAGYSEKEVAGAVPVYVVTEWIPHAWDYDAIMKEVLLNRERTAGVIEKDGKTVLLYASKQKSVWNVCPDEEQKGDLGTVIAQYGNDFLYARMGYVILAEEPNTMYDVGQFTGQQTSLTPYPFTLSEYAKASARLALRMPMYDENDDIVLSVNDFSVAYAEEYWDYLENKELRDTQFAIGFFAVVGSIAAGLITLAVWLSRRRKAKEREQG